MLASLQDLGYLVTKRKLEDEDNFEDWVNHHSKVGAAVCRCGPLGVTGSTTTAARWVLLCARAHGANPHSKDIPGRGVAGWSPA